MLKILYNFCGVGKYIFKKRNEFYLVFKNVLVVIFLNEIIYVIMNEICYNVMYYIVCDYDNFKFFVG